MSIFFPDNDHRKQRLTQLSSDTQHFLTQAKTAYQQFLTLNTAVNQKIAAVYQKAGLQAPAVTPVDILHAQKAIYNVTTADTVVSVSKLLLDVGGLVVSVYYLAPAATAMLVDTGVLGAETASAVLFSALGAEVTVGALAGGLVAGLVVGIIVVGIGFAIDAFEGCELRDQLRKGIYQMDQLRASTKFALDKSQTLVNYLQSVKTTCDSLLASDIPLTDTIINNLIQKNAIPALKAIEAVTKESVLAALQQLDKSRGSWTNEDEAGKDIVLPAAAPIYISAGIVAPVSSCPAIPAGLKLTALQDPNRLDSTLNYPILQIEDIQYWPFSYIDNRVGMAIVAFDRKGNAIKRWDKTGARYIWKIEEDPGNNDIVFVGQSGQKILMKWSELTNLSFDFGTCAPTRLCPMIPSGLKLTALQDPDKLDMAANYPILTIGNVQYWPFSYTDNRLGMAIVAFNDQGSILKRWDKTGARYIWKIERYLNAQQVAFTGQGTQKIMIPWSELTTI